MFTYTKLTNGVNGTGDDSDVVYLHQWKASYTINFKWGSMFNGANPGLYYDSPEGLEAVPKDKDVETTLNALHEALNGVSYTVNFVASVN